MPHTRLVLSSLAAAAFALCAWPMPAGADEAQVAQGEKLFAKHCAKCHGKSGEGGKKAPPVVGKEALPLDPPPGAKIRKSQFQTAQDVAEFVSTKMPANKPGSLKPDEYYEILAFDLKANGVDLGDKKLDAASAAQVKLH